MRIFQTFLLPDDLVGKYKLSYAAANFSRNLVLGKCFDKVYSLMPLTVKGKIPTITDNGYEVIYSNWRMCGSILARLAILHEQWKIFRQIKKSDSLWLYNLNVMNAMLFIFVKLFKSRVKLNIIMLDFTPAESWRDQNYWYLKLINRADGLICLAESSFFNIKNSALLAGVVPLISKKYPKIDDFNKEFLLSGVISPIIATTPMVLKIFSQMPDCILHITGNVPEGEDMVKEYAERYSNIKYHGSLSYNDYLDLLQRVTFVLSTRDESYPENQCNFPSKIIEALLNNRIVISTIYYKQLGGIKYFKVDSNCEKIKRQILEICNKPNKILKKYANQASFLKKILSTEVWSNKMTDIENYSK